MGFSAAETDAQATDDPQAACVWHMPVKTDWDEWDLVAFFHFFEPASEASGSQVPLRFTTDFKHLGLSARNRYWAYEFWTWQFLGVLPTSSKSKNSYRHPGDLALPTGDSAPGVLDVAFQGPAVRMLVLRKPKKHPWPVGTSFHLSGGSELRKVRWNKAKRTLSGGLHRPPGQTGAIVIAGAEAAGRIVATVDGKTAPATRGANGSLHLPVVTRNWETRWSIRFSG